jgi:ATP-dependent helicase/nuclease subunit A
VSGAYPGLQRNAVVAASAGTGKTHFLTNVYVGRALGLGSSGRPVSPARIVATTFSRAAALELRERIETRLVELAETAPSPSLALGRELLPLADALGLDDAALRERARHALTELPGALIDTLHGVATWVLRRHALELELVPDFAILDEQQSTDDCRAAVDDVLAEALESGADERVAALALIDACRGLEPTEQSVRYLLDRLDDEGLDAADLSHGSLTQAATELREELRSVTRAIVLDGASALFEPAQALHRVLGDPTASLAVLSEAVERLFVVRLTAALKRLPGALELEDFLESVRGDNKADRAQRLARFLHFAEELEQNSAGVGRLISRAQARLYSERAARGGFGFGDLLRGARDALRDRPELAAASAASIDLLLVDEFQDTSRVQRDLVLLLRERPDAARARRAGSLPSTRTLLPNGLVVVGDRKQSIYGFRGADVSVFAEFAAELAGARAATALELRGVEVNPDPVADFHSLKHNYRSQAAIIEAVNLIAEHDFESRPTYPYQVRYAEEEALSLPPSAEGSERGRFTLIVDDGTVPEGAPPLVAEAGAPLRAALIAAGFCRASVEEGSAYRDLAILARRRATLPLVELALDRLGIPFVVSGRELYATREVRDLFAALSVAQNPLDRHALATVARGLPGGLADPTLAALAEPGRGLLPARQWRLTAIDEPEQREAASLLCERLADFARIAPRLSPRDAIGFALELFDFERLLAGLPRGQVRFGNLLRLLEIAARHGGSLPAFTRFLQEQILTEADEAEAAVFSEEDDAVRLVTIHGSKGLAFPVVVLLDLAVAEQPRGGPLGLLREGAGPPRLVLRQRVAEGTVHDPLQKAARDDLTRRAVAERQRLSYVALTRARRELALVLPADAPRPQTLADTVQRCRDASLFAPIEGTREIAASDLLSPETAEAATALEFALPVPHRPELSEVTELSIGATALADYALCARRFELVHVLGFDEPSPLGLTAIDPSDDDPRSLGSAAHRVLEIWPLERWGEPTPHDQVLNALVREGVAAGDAANELAAGVARFLSGAFAGRARGARRVLRELELATLFDRAISAPQPSKPRRGKVRERANPLQLTLFAPGPAEPTTGAGAHGVLLKTTLDLLVEHEDGSFDVVDYKRSKGRFRDRHALQLSAYRSAVAQHFRATEVKTGLVHLLGGDGEPHWVDPVPFDVARLAQSLGRARWEEHFPPVQKSACERIGCGFVGTCHGERERVGGF